MANSRKLRVLLAGGGTGGHIYPLVAISNRVRFILSHGGVEYDVRYFGYAGNFGPFLENNGIKIVSIASSKLRRYFSILNFLDFFKFFIGIIQALVKIYFFMPDVVLSKGGPGVLPIIIVCKIYQIPIVVHESDAVPGLTNSITAKYADIVELSFEEAKQYFAKNRVVNVTGVPVRETIFTKEPTANSRKVFGLADEKPILLVLGGSQGAQALNNFIMENAKTLMTDFEIIHQTGKDNFQEYKNSFDFITKYFSPEIKNHYLMFPYLDDTQLAHALNSADIVVSRAGATSISEISAVSKPAILIPLPDSANNHQVENAYVYARTGAAFVIEQENLLLSLFISQIAKILETPEGYQKMCEAAGGFYKADAGERVADDIITLSGIVKSLGI